MPNNQTTTDHAYARLRDLEGTQRGFHFDGMIARVFVAHSKIYPLVLS